MKLPSHLKKPGRDFWKALVAEYDIRDAAGITLLTTAAECLDRMRAAQVAIKRDGLMTTDRYGQPKIHPARPNLSATPTSGFWRL